MLFDKNQFLFGVSFEASVTLVILYDYKSFLESNLNPNMFFLFI